MNTSIPGYCLSLLLFTAIATNAGSNGTNDEESREPRVSGRIVKLYSGTKPELYFCTGEGFQADPSNCASFFRCVKERSGKFTVFRYQCAPGTIFDPDLETCNHPRSTRRTECGGVLKQNIESHHSANMNEIEGTQSELPRPISTEVPIYGEQSTPKNPTIVSSITTKSPSKMPWTSVLHGSPSTLSISSTKPSHYTTNKSQPTTQRQWESQYTSKSIPKITQSSDSKNSEPCTSDGFMGDSENCRKFYRCVRNQRGGYIKYEFSCSESTVWDDEIQGCNHPWAIKKSKCGRSLSYDDKSTSLIQDLDSTEESTTKVSILNNGEFDNKYNKTIQQQLQISHGSEVTQAQTQISNSSDVIQNQTQINYGNEVQNHNNSKSKQNQSQISYWGAVSQSQTQVNYGNKGIQTQLQIDHSRDSSQSQVQIVDSTTQFTKSTPASNNVKNECSESGFMGDSNDCKKFYRCVNNGKGYTKYEFFCSDGTVWDPNIEACNHAWAVKECGATYSNVVSTPETHSTTTPKSTEYNTEYIKTTSSYATSQITDISDEDDIGYGNQNNHESTLSATTTTKTTTTVKSTTPPSSGASPECTINGFMGDLNACNVFYRCVDNGSGGFIKYEFKCGDGTVWDPNIEACNHVWAVKKCGGYSTSSESDKEETTTKKDNKTPSETTVHTTVTLIQISTQAPTKDDNHAVLTTTISSSTISKPATQTQEQTSNNNNVCNSIGFVGDEYDCKKFYRCVDNGNGGYIKYEFTCGQGTVWDPKIDACNHDWAVDKCGGNNNINSQSSGLETTSQFTSSIGSDHSSSIQTTEASKDTDGLITNTSTTSNINTSPNTSNKCLNSGFVGDSTDCKKFYRCVDNGDGSYSRYEFTCGEGTVWDSKIEACNHAWAVEKCGGSSDSVVTHEPHQTTSGYTVVYDEQSENGYITQNYETPVTFQSTVSSSLDSITSSITGGTSHCNNSGFIGDKNDCKKFYRCVDNGKGDYDLYVFQCGDGTVWDQSIEACNHAWAVKVCGGSGSNTTNFQSESTTQSFSSSQANDNVQTQHFTEETTTTTEIHPEIAPIMNDECIHEGFYGYKKNCNMFYRCVYNGNGQFTKYEFTCGEGTSWNQDIQGCDHISSDRPCSNSISQVITTQQPMQLNDDMDAQSMSTTKATTIIESTESHITQTNTSTESSKGICNSEGFYANPTNCKKFYRCVANGDDRYTKYDFNCGDGTVWNQEIQACDHESSDKLCTASSTTQTQTIEVQSQGTTISYLTTNKQETTGKPETSGSMGSQCTSEGFYAHPNNCKKFIRCVDNGKGGYTQYDFSCGEGTVWVQEIQACDHDNDVNSCGSQVGSTISSQPTSQQSNTEKDSSSTPSSSVTSSTEILPLNDESHTQTSNQPSHDETKDCTSEGYFANKQDCKKFYRCVDNGKGRYTKYDFVCGEGTAWDSDLQTCNYINEVQSCTGSYTEQNTNHQTTTNKNQVQSESTSSTTKATTSSGTSSSSNSHNTCENEGYFGDSKNCKKFYRCVDNGKGGYTKYDYTCGEGTIWDQDITTCNYPQDVSNPSCISNQDSSDTSSTTSSSTSSQATTGTSSSNSSSTSNCSQESSKKPANNSVHCDKAGYYGNPNDCKKFYRCVDWDGDGKRFSVFHFECGEGTIWDPTLDTCNHEDSVYPQRNCSQEQSQNVGGETTTTESSMTTDNTATTTTESSSEQTTQGSTSEYTTAQPATSEKTTTEQPYESTTIQPTSTSQESTTDEQTSTQKTTTSENIATEESTSEQTTTQQSATSNQTTTQQPAISEQTTTQQPATSEQTTTQQPTTEQTTTSEQTTTQQPATSDQTTTQQPATSEQTTTQPPATIEQTTTQQPTTEQTTTSEQTTTQQPATSDQTTTQQPATSEQTTTQQPATSEQTTTQQPTTEQTTTSEQTTTQQSTTIDQTTVQQLPTSEHTTTQQATTEQTTTQQSSESTTQQYTTIEYTTAEQTTTSEKTTTQQPTTSESITTQQSTTEESSSQESSENTTQTTTEQTTTQQFTTSEQTTTQQSTTTDQTTTQQFTTEQTTTQQFTTTDQTTQQITTPEQTTSQQSTTTDQTTTQESNTSEQTTTQQSTTIEQTTTQQSTTSEQATTEQPNASTTEQTSSTTEQTTDTTTTTDSSTEGTTTEETTDQSTTQKSSTESDSTDDLSSTTEESTSNKKCPETEDDQYLLVCPTSFKRHPKYCNMFYQCTEDDETSEAKVAMFKCPNNTIYDENQTKCVTEDKSDKKCDGEIANKRRFKRLGSNYKELIEADNQNMTCTSTGYYAFEKRSECAKGFLKCEKNNRGVLRGLVYQCPDGYVYWSISKRCERIESVKDCKRSSNDWTERWNIPVERKNVAYS